jgi:hypothetical protein
VIDCVGGTSAQELRFFSRSMRMNASFLHVASPQHKFHKISHSRGTSFAILRLACGDEFSDLPLEDEKITREWMNVPQAIGFAFEMEGLLLLECSDRIAN